MSKHSTLKIHNKNMKLMEYVNTGFDKVFAHSIRPSSSIIVTGFWRSGTTWLQQVISNFLKAKPIFEPFHWSVDSYSDIVRDTFSIPRIEDSYLKLFMPCVQISDYPDFRLYVRSILRGEASGVWMRRGRQLRDIIAQRVVVKFVRGQLLVPSLCETFSPTTLVHIRRDPRAIVASILREGWGSWMLQLSLVDQLLRPDDERRHFFIKWEDEIRRYDEDDFVARVTAYWALTERFVQHYMVERGVHLEYNQLCINRSDYLNGKFDSFIGLSEGFNEEHLGGNSPTTTRRNNSTSARLNSWKDELSSKEVRAIESVVLDFDLDHSLS